MPRTLATQPWPMLIPRSVFVFFSLCGDALVSMRIRIFGDPTFYLCPDPDTGFVISPKVFCFLFFEKMFCYLKTSINNNAKLVKCQNIGYRSTYVGTGTKAFWKVAGVRECKSHILTTLCNSKSRSGSKSRASMRFRHQNTFFFTWHLYLLPSNLCWYYNLMLWIRNYLFRIRILSSKNSRSYPLKLGPSKYSKF